MAALQAQPVSPAFRTGARLVYTPIGVLDKKGHPVHDVAAENVKLYDNGREREIYFEESSEPTSVAVVVQADWASGNALRAVQRIAPMIGPLIAGEGGSLAFISYHFDVHIEHGFTEGGSSFTAAMSELAAGGTGSGLLDAVSVSIDLLSAQPGHRRRIVLAISQGSDTGSKTRLEELLVRAERER